jgi:hypothetical protein
MSEEYKPLSKEEDGGLRQNVSFPLYCVEIGSDQTVVVGNNTEKDEICRWWWRCSENWCHK